MTFQLPQTIQENIDQFSGRAWLLPIIQQWLADPNSEQVFLLTGGPGTGKSMIMGWLSGSGPVPDDEQAQARLTSLRQQVTVAHFCQSNTRNITPQAFAQTAANQLVSAINGFGDALTKVLSDRIVIQTTQKIGQVAAGGTVTGNKIGTINVADLDDSVAFDRTFVQPLQQLYENGYAEPLLILVDALDEAWPDARGQQLVKLLGQLRNLPRKATLTM